MISEVVSQVRQGMIPAHIYADPEIFALERDRLFARSWVFLAHESEIPDPGDYVVRREILLCPLELEALTWQDHELFARLLQTPHGPED